MTRRFRVLQTNINGTFKQQSNLPSLLITTLTPPYSFFRMDKEDDESIFGDVVEDIREVLIDKGHCHHMNLTLEYI